MVTGRAGTPYFGGVFIFDVFFPHNYPDVPPLVQNLSTGQGTWRAANNLYGDGKVCVSLLQNFSADASEKWDPEKSSLYQVLMAIQTDMLEEEPFFKSGHADAPPGSAAATERSQAFNYDVALGTAQHAMGSMMRDAFHPLRSRRRFGSGGFRRS